MLILYDRRIRASLSSFRHAQIWAVERLIHVNCASGDIRWAILALALRALSALWALAQKQFFQRLRKIAARFTADADSMLAAGGQYTRDNTPNMRILSMMILYGLDLWTTMSPLLTPRWQQGWLA